MNKLKRWAEIDIFRFVASLRMNQTQEEEKKNYNDNVPWPFRMIADMSCGPAPPV